MGPNRTTARLLGALFLTVMVTWSIGYILIDSTISGPDYLTGVSLSKLRVIVGALFELIEVAGVVGIAVMIFPILKRHNENIARGYLCFRILECVMLVVAVISPLLLIKLSQEYVKAGAPDASHFQTLGTLFQEARYWAGQMVGIFFSLGALMFYFLLYQSRLLPRFISVWGLAGATLALTGTLLDMFGHSAQLILGVPMGLNELFLGAWLIAKGFNSPEIAAACAKTGMNGNQMSTSEV